MEVESPVTTRDWFVVMVTETDLYRVGNGVTISLVIKNNGINTQVVGDSVDGFLCKKT